MSTETIIPTVGDVRVVESPEKRSQRISIGVLVTLLGAVLLWDVLFRGQLGFTFTFLKYGDLAFEGQLGGALHDAKLKNDPSGRDLGCHALFHLGLDVDWRVTQNWSAQPYASHISNADLCDDNNGYESAGLRVGYHF